MYLNGIVEFLSLFVSTVDVIMYEKGRWSNSQCKPGHDTSTRCVECYLHAYTPITRIMSIILIKLNVYKYITEILVLFWNYFYWIPLATKLRDTLFEKIESYTSTSSKIHKGQLTLMTAFIQLGLNSGTCKDGSAETTEV